VVAASAALTIGLIGLMVFDSVQAAWPAFQTFGLGFVTGIDGRRHSRSTAR